MPTNLFIMTGATRGLGLSMARQLLSQGHSLLCIARTEQPALTRHAEQSGSALLQWRHDLAESAVLAERLKAWLHEPRQTAWRSATLINNAAAIAGIQPLSAADAAELAQALRVGLEAPMVLTSAFLRATQSWQVPRKVLNISSGLGRRPMASQAPYCAAKAGLDHFSRCLALEEALKPGGAMVCSLAPGVIDTDMQLQLRSASAADFPDQDAFERLKANGQLSMPDEAARRVLAYLNRPDFGAQPVDDVRDEAARPAGQ